MTRIVVIGLGYVGLANAVHLAEAGHEVFVHDIDTEKQDLVRRGISPLAEQTLAAALAGLGGLPGAAGLAATLKGAEIVLIATPTNYDDRSARFDTASVEASLDALARHAPAALAVIRSTVPTGFCAAQDARLRGMGAAGAVFCPEFLREGQALADCRAPSRVVVGDRGERGARVAALFAGTAAGDPPVHLTGPGEAEAIKLFSNTYLAMRVAFFNELDSFALATGLEAGEIVAGVCDDPRIGSGYNNPSFGYGGYCLPKDTRQLLANYDRVPQTLIRAVVEANETRMRFIATQVATEVLARGNGPVGIAGLEMKAGSDNWRGSAMLGVLYHLLGQGLEVLVHQPGLPGPRFCGAEIVPDLAALKNRACLVIANRNRPELADIAHKVFSRDIFAMD